jgi:hypothetical protein
MTQVINTGERDSSGTNAILIVLLLAAVVAFGVWFFGQGVVPAANNEDPGINVDVNLPTGGTQQPAPTTPAPTTPTTPAQ